ncbi:secreted protein [Melampsora americana]|nr:secreted protein [Melampsora americana]
MHTYSILVAILLASFSLIDALTPPAFGFSSPMQSYNEYTTTTSYNSDQGAAPMTTTVVHGVNGLPPVTYTTTTPIRFYKARRGIHSQGGEGGSDENPPVFMPDAHSVPNPIENSSEDPIFHSGEIEPIPDDQPMQSDANNTLTNDVHQ